MTIYLLFFRRTLHSYFYRYASMVPSNCDLEWPKNHQVVLESKMVLNRTLHSYFYRYASMVPSSCDLEWPKNHQVVSESKMVLNCQQYS